MQSKYKKHLIPETGLTVRPVRCAQETDSLRAAAQQVFMLYCSTQSATEERLYLKAQQSRTVDFIPTQSEISLIDPQHVQLTHYG